MNYTQNLYFVSLITHASFFVQLIIILLMLTSILSWTCIFRKIFAIRSTNKKTKIFEQIFWSTDNVIELYEKMLIKCPIEFNHYNNSLERIFQVGMKEFYKTKIHIDKNTIIHFNNLLDSARRAMRATYQREIGRLESDLTVLASVGSISPYIGLFGTVLGIMNTFYGFTALQQATLLTIAPNIAEALITTAIGLFVAIPAVIAYNSYIHDIAHLAIRFESFIEEFSNVLQQTYFYV